MNLHKLFVCLWPVSFDLRPLGRTSYFPLIPLSSWCALTDHSLPGLNCRQLSYPSREWPGFGGSLFCISTATIFVFASEGAEEGWESRESFCFSSWFLQTEIKKSEKWRKVVWVEQEGKKKQRKKNSYLMGTQTITIGSLGIIDINGNINTNVKNVLKISAAWLVLNRFFFMIVFMFPFVFIICKLPIIVCL